MKRKIINHILDIVVGFIIIGTSYIYISKTFLCGSIATSVYWGYLMLVQGIREIWKEIRDRGNVEHYHFDESEMY